MPKRIRPKTRQAVRTRPAPAAVRTENAAAATTTFAPAAPARAFSARAAARPVGGPADYSYVLKDLVRIAIIAVVILGGMGLLKLVNPG